MTFALYVAPPGWHRPVAVAAVLALAAVNYRGITRTARLTRVVVVVVLACLGVGVAASLADGDVSTGGPATWASFDGGWYGVLQSAGVLFFAFAG